MSERGDPGFTFIGILILAALGTFAWRSAPLESARRPSEPAAAPEILVEGSVPARLWQDPLKAVRLHQAVAGTQAMMRRSPLASEIKNLANQAERVRLTVLSVMVSPGDYSELEERRRRRRYAVLAGIGDAGFVPRDAETLGVLPMPLVQAPDTETLGVFSMRPVQGSDSKVDQGTNEAADLFNIPYELYDYEDPNTGSPLRSGPGSKQVVREIVLVLWLDESRFTHSPFVGFQQLISFLLPEEVHDAFANNKQPGISWKVIGPARSGTLRKLVENQCGEAVKWLHEGSRLERFDILSPVATVSDSDLRRHRPKPGCDLNESNAIHPPLLSGYFGETCDGKNATCLRFLRTIQSDDVLIDELRRELRRRGLRANDNVVVLSEWDTYFGRFLPRTFAASKTHEQRSHYQEASPRFDLLRLTYERGIDGITAGIMPEALEKTATGERDLFNVLSPTESLAVRRPEGTAQFDYLRRLADRILRIDRQLRLRKASGIRAVAILGSDVYDKLLILRALRHRLSGTIWVTTDLDAHFLHPGEFRWTRNLVVAATFGLTLPQDVQPSHPPFRDSYQTAVYLATRMAVDLNSLREVDQWHTDSAVEASVIELYPTQDEMNRLIPPRLFEVGRHGAMPLGTAASSGKGNASAKARAINIEARESPALAYFIGGGLISILALLALHQVRPLSGRPVLSIGALILFGVLLALTAVLQVRTGEPISLSDGVSIWPTEFVRLTAIFLAISFLWIAYHRLQANAWLLDHQYFCGGKQKQDIGLTLRQAKDRLKNVKDVKFRAWFFGTIVLAILLMVAMRYIGALQWSLTEKLLVLGFGWALVIGVWLLFVNGRVVPSVRVRSINQWLAAGREEQEDTAGELWTSYREHGALRHRVLRSFTYLLVYFAFGTLVFTLLGSPSPPCRGTTACMIDGILLGFGVLLMLFLLFFVVDATRLCICWIEALQSPQLSWEDSSQGQLAKQLGLPSLHATYYLQIHLIGERTTEVGRLLYYPVIIILLMLLSRTTYFDDWGFPRALAVIVATNFLIAVVAAARLNAAARQARDSILDRLRSESLELQTTEAKRPAVATPDEVKELIGQLSQLRIGAFQQLWDQPLVRGSLLLLSGIGVTYFEYLA